MPAALDGVVVGMGQDLSLMACDDCGLVAVPLEFDGDGDRQTFRAAQAAEPPK